METIEFKMEPKQDLSISIKFMIRLIYMILWFIFINPILRDIVIHLTVFLEMDSVLSSRVLTYYWYITIIFQMAFLFNSNKTKYDLYNKLDDINRSITSNSVLSAQYSKVINKRLDEIQHNTILNNKQHKYY